MPVRNFTYNFGIGSDEICTDLWVHLTGEIYLLNPNWKSSVFQQELNDVIITLGLP